MTDLPAITADLLEVAQPDELDELERILDAEAHDAELQAAHMMARERPFEVLGYVPTERQVEFHDAAEYDVLYGGAAGGGKTLALVMDDIRDCMRYPGLRVGAFRRTYDELAESLLKELQAIDYARALGASWNGTQRELRFANQSVVRYRYAETVEDATRRQGGEYQKLTIDERTLMAPGVVDVLAERLRSGRRDIPVVGIRSGTNPGGPGHAQVKTRFIEATAHGQKTVVDEHGFTVRFIPAKVSDNPHVDPAYRARLDAIPDPKRRAAMRDGDWDVFAGQFFSEWRRSLHVVEPFPVPSEWPRVAGIDYGYANPWAVEWLAEDRDGRIWVYLECYEKGVTERDQARRVKLLERGQPPVRRFADPAMWAKTGAAASPAQAYADLGVRLERATNDRIPGWQLVHTMLSEQRAACAIHRETGLEVCPTLHVFSTCADLVRTLPSLPHDSRRPEDVDTHAEDHAPDALRYGLMGVRRSRPAKVRSAAGGSVPRGASVAQGRARVAMGAGAAVGRR